MSSINYFAIARCSNCEMELRSDFNDIDPMVNIKMSVGRLCDQCNHSHEIETEVTLCSLKCVREFVEKNKLTTTWKHRLESYKPYQLH